MRILSPLLLPLLLSCAAPPTPPPAWVVLATTSAGHRGLGHQGKVVEMAFGTLGRLVLSVAAIDEGRVRTEQHAQTNVSPGDHVWAGVGTRALEPEAALDALTSLLPVEQANKVRAAAGPLPAATTSRITLGLGVTPGIRAGGAHQAHLDVTLTEPSRGGHGPPPSAGPAPAGSICIAGHRPEGSGPPEPGADLDPVTGCPDLPAIPGAWAAWVTFVPLAQP